MNTRLPLVVTISRLFGSGGAYLGRRLASRLKSLYLDNEICQQAAQKLKMSPEEISLRDENITPFWARFYESCSAFKDELPQYVPPSLNLLYDQGIFNAEKEVILRAAGQEPAVIVGRAGYYILRDHPNHLSILLHASDEFRRKRLQELYKFSEEEAIKAVLSTDKRRTKYLKAVTGSEWSNARQFHLCLDTGIVGLKESEEIILKILSVRFGINLQ